jgi:hypothetical protein
LTAKIAIASTLKPVIDPRAYEKIGKSLAHRQHYQVHILGSLPTTDPVATNIILNPIVKNNGGISRFLIPWKILNALFKIKPEVLIICTHELLLIGSIYKLFIGSKLIYDIQENYLFNLIYQKNYFWGLRHFLAFYVRAKETFLSNFVDHFLLAEQCYADEIKFIKQRYSIIENKFIAPQFEQKKQNQVRVEFLLSGTISTEYGVLDALRFFKELPASKYKLILVGHCPNKRTFRVLKKEVNGVENIDFNVSATPVPHQEILAHIGNKTIALLPYQVNKSTAMKMPTKLYEYIGLGIPVLISANPLWDNLVNKYHAGLSIDFKSPIYIDNISKRLTLTKEVQVVDLKDIMWNNEEIKLFAVLKNLIS